MPAPFMRRWARHLRRSGNFVETPFEQWVERRLDGPDFDPSLWFVVRDGDEIAAVLRGEPERGAPAGSGRSACGRPWRKRGLGLRASPARLRRVLSTRPAPRWPRRRCAKSDGRDPSLRTRGHAGGLRGRCVREGARVSRLRAKCPDCKTFTAVALGPEYECHSCGRTFRAGLVRVPQAWGEGGEAMAEAAWLELPYPETAVSRRTRSRSRRSRSLPTARSPAHARRLLLRAHRCGRGARGAAGPPVRDLVRRARRPQHGGEFADGEPVGDAAAKADRLRRGRRRRRGPRRRAQPRSTRGGVHPRPRSPSGRGGDRRGAQGTAGMYVAFDVDVLEPAELAVFMPEPGGLALSEAERLLSLVAAKTNILGAGLSAASFEPGTSGRSRGSPRRPGFDRGGAARPGTRFPQPPSPGRFADRRSRRRCAPAYRRRRAGLNSQAPCPPGSTSPSSTERPRARPGKQHPNTCPTCGSHYRDDELEAALWVCPQCGHHFPMRAPTRIASLADEGSFVEEAAELRSEDPLDFFDLRPYTERLAEAELKTGLGEAIVIGRALDRRPSRASWR